MDHDELDIEVIEPMKHNRWAVIVPALDLVANIAGDFERAFKNWAILGAQHGMQVHYDERFKGVTDGWDSSFRPGEVLPED